MPKVSTWRVTDGAPFSTWLGPVNSADRARETDDVRDVGPDTNRQGLGVRLVLRSCSSHSPSTETVPVEPSIPSWSNLRILGRPLITFRDEYIGSSLSTSPISEAGFEALAASDDAYALEVVRGISGIAVSALVMYTVGSITSLVSCAAASASQSVFDIHSRCSVCTSRENDAYNWVNHGCLPEERTAHTNITRRTEEVPLRALLR